jgi:hypothetical protein
MISLAYEAFVYCWTDKKTNKLYVGSHKGSTDDGYICSSKYMMEEYNKRPEDFNRQVIAEGELSIIRKYETKILQAANARLDKMFYNKHDNDGFYFDGWKKGEMSAEHRAKLAAAKKGRKISKEHHAKLVVNRKGSKNSPEHAAAIIASRIGSKHSEESKKKMSESRKNNPNIKLISSEAGKASQKSRKDSGYYQSEEWKQIVKLGWEKRRANKLKKIGESN